MKKLLLLASLALLVCGCAKEYNDSALNSRIDSLEQRLSAVETVLRAYEKNLTIQSVEKTADGYVIIFSDGSKATITNGVDGRDGANGKDGQNGADGKDGANGKDGENGADGKDGVDGKDGKDGVDGRDGKDGETLIDYITITESGVLFRLTDGREFFIPFYKEFEFAISFDTTDVAILEGGQSVAISYSITGATDNTVVKALSQDGWKAQVNAMSKSSGTITVTAPNPIVESEILVFANDGSYRTLMVTLNCIKGEISVADDAVSIGADGGTQQIKLFTNMTYSIDIPENAKDWISVADTRAMREDTLTFTIAKNTGLARFATVLLKDSRNNILQTLVFKQLGVGTEIYVEKKGDLEKVLADYDYANMKILKISGVLNDVDFLFIYRMMPKLRDLDISEVEITSLPTQAFYNSKNVENIVLPNTLTAIGNEMFYSSNLKSVIIPANVKTIGDSAFYNCPITAIEIPASVEIIEAAAFKECTQLTTVTFEKDSQLKTIGGGYPSNIVSDYGAFSGCISLTSIEIPASVGIIEAAAFKRCTRLTTVIFEKGSQLKTIGGGSNGSSHHGAFSDCPIRSIEIPASVETIGEAAFKGCSQLTTVTFEKGSQLKTIGGGYNGSSYHGAFSDCPIRSIEIPASVEIIEAAAFYKCTKLTTVTFEKSSQFKTINNNTFYYCSSLISIEIPASVETIEKKAFEGCSQLTTVTFEKGSQLKTIKGGVFSLLLLWSILPVSKPNDGRYVGMHPGEIN